jgi:hypothetical protein
MYSTQYLNNKKSRLLTGYIQNFNYLHKEPYNPVAKACYNGANRYG